MIGPGNVHGIRTHFGYGSVHVSEPILGMGQIWVQDLGVGTGPIFYLVPTETHGFKTHPNQIGHGHVWVKSCDSKIKI